MAKKPCQICGVVLQVNAKSRPNPTCQDCRSRLPRAEKIALGICKPQKQYPGKSYDYKKAPCANCGELAWKSHPERADGLTYHRDCRPSALPVGQCERCGTEVRGQRRFCSRACISKWYTCLHCGESFTRAAGPKEALKYCGRSCSLQARARTPKAPRPCNCGNTKAPRRNLCIECIAQRERDIAQRALVLSEKREAKRAADEAKANARSQWRCEVCLSAEMWHINSPYCAPCRRVLTKGKKEHRSRARHFGVPYEAVNAAAVFQRDNWTCHLCSEPISREAKWPDQMCASLDHVIPMSKGGPHSYTNVAASHWLCNVLKSDDGAIHFRVA
jgi:hypothetical protein